MGVLTLRHQRHGRKSSRPSISVFISSFLNFCMSQKAELPSLTGHRTKTRKRDEKKVNDPSGFRDSVIEGLAKAGVGGVDLEDLDVQVDLDAVYKFLDTAGNKLDYRRYGEVLLEILIAGGLLAPGGSIQQDGEKGMVQTRACIFQDAVDLERVKAWDQVFIKLMRRYKYLEKMLSEEMRKILVYLRGFSQEHRARLAQVTALWVASGLILPNTLVVIINEHQVKDSVALDFMLEVLSVVKTEKGSSAVLTLLKRSGLDLMLDQLFPANKRTPENIKNSFISAGQPDIVTYLAGLENAGAKKDIQRSLRISISDEKPTKEIIMDLKESVKKNGLLEQEAVAMIWSAVMSACEWNKKEDLVHEQALKHLKNYISLFSAFTSSAKSEMVLCNKVQEYCYDNQNFLKCFNKIVLLFYKTEVLSEEVILKWYKDGHVPKGWTVFMEQMKKFIDWLEQAESGLKRQAGGVSLSSLMSCLSPHSTTHPWTQDFGAWLPAGTLYSLHQLASAGCSDKNGVIETIEKLMGVLREGGATEDLSKTLELVVLKVLESGEISKEATDTLGKVWYLGKCGFALNDPKYWARILEHCTEMFVREIESLIVEALEVEVSEDFDPFPSKHSYLVEMLLVRTVSCSQNLFTMSIQIFATYLVENRWNSYLLKFYQLFVSAVLGSVRNPILLYPFTMQPLVSLLITYKELVEFGRGSDVAKVVKDRFDLNDLNVKMILLQYPTIARDLIK